MNEHVATRAYPSLPTFQLEVERASSERLDRASEGSAEVEDRRSV